MHDGNFEIAWLRDTPLFHSRRHVARSGCVPVHNQKISFCVDDKHMSPPQRPCRLIWARKGPFLTWTFERNLLKSLNDGETTQLLRMILNIWNALLLPTKNLFSLLMILVYDMESSSWTITSASSNTLRHCMRLWPAEWISGCFRLIVCSSLQWVLQVRSFITSLTVIALVYANGYGKQADSSYIPHNLPPPSRHNQLKYRPNSQSPYPTFVFECAVTDENRDRLLDDAEAKHFHVNTSIQVWLGLKVRLGQVQHGETFWIGWGKRRSYRIWLETWGAIRGWTWCGNVPPCVYSRQRCIAWTSHHPNAVDLSTSSMSCQRARRPSSLIRGRKVGYHRWIG